MPVDHSVYGPVIKAVVGAIKETPVDSKEFFMTCVEFSRSEESMFGGSNKIEFTIFHPSFHNGLSVRVKWEGSIEIKTDERALLDRT